MFPVNIFLDFDDVLFNTGKLIRDIQDIFLSVGLNQKDFEFDYRKQIKTKRKFLPKYNPREHIKVLEKVHRKKLSGLRNQLEELLKNTEKYVFSDVKPFLEENSQADFYLISYGESNFQQDKIYHSGITQYFKKIMITATLKSRALKNNRLPLRGYANYFLDDRIEQINDIKKNVNNIKTFLVRREEGRYRDNPSTYCDFTIENLKQASQIINNN